VGEPTRDRATVLGGFGEPPRGRGNCIAIEPSCSPAPARPPRPAFPV